MSDVPENALTLYERDGGLLWKHFDYETGKSDARRAREFVNRSAAASAPGPKGGDIQIATEIMLWLIDVVRDRVFY
jgi:methylglyoxal synthase